MPDGVNRLARATSPYLRQHADNPVPWWEWEPAALAAAREQDRPILLSIGYSACHWCHVMAYESFEDPRIAALIEADFIAIKVDREERPDLDELYQRVVQLQGEGGGWPLTVFLLPDGRPFFGGTYFPPRPRWGRPGFAELLEGLAAAWRERRDEVERQAERYVAGLAAVANASDEGAAAERDPRALLGPEALRSATRRLVDRSDARWGGFGQAPKFPCAPALELLLCAARGAKDDAVAGAARGALRRTLEAMWRGGLWDHLAGGFARYSVDREWRVPHFEKMLYDNAQLLPVYAEARVLWPEDAHLAEVPVGIVAWLEGELADGHGTWAAALDADSEGEEGRYYVWTPQELEAALGREEGRVMAADLGVTPEGNFEQGRSVLYRPHAQLSAPEGHVERRTRLLEVRRRRVPPARDDKVLTSWNALLVSGLARAARALRAMGDEPVAHRLGERAQRALRRLQAGHLYAEGVPARQCVAGRPHGAGFLDDLAYLARAALDLHEWDLDPEWLGLAGRLAAAAVARHGTPGGDGFYFVPDDGERLLERSEAPHDGAVPSGLGVLLEALARLEPTTAAPEGTAQILERVFTRRRAAATEPFLFASVVCAARWASAQAIHVGLAGPDRTATGVRALAVAVDQVRLAATAPIGVSWRDAPTLSVQVCRAGVCAQVAPQEDTLAACLLAHARAC